MMVPSSIRAKGAATALSVMALAAGLMLGVRNAPVEMAGGGAAAPSQLGSSFADLAAGTETAEPVETVQTADPVQPTAPDEAADPAEPTPPEPTHSEQPPESAEPVEAKPTEQPAPQETPQPTAVPETPTPTVPVQTADPTLPAMPDVAADSPAPVEPVQATPPEPVEPVETPPAETAPPPEAETITGESLPPGVVVSSRRPPTRSDEFEDAHRRPDPPPQPDPAPTRQAQSQPATQARGNADRSERAESQANTGGSSSGASARRQATQAGNAAASNYPGEVMRRLSRVPRPSVRAAGSAVVSFSVAGSGGLGSVGIARSSGSGALDRAAVQLVRRAAPFPAPPPGAQRSFSITIAGR